VAGIAPEIHPGDADVLNILLGRVTRPDVVVVEVGSWVGNGSTRVIAQAIRPASGRLYCVDTWAGSDNVPHHQDFRLQYSSMFPIFAENVRHYGGEEVIRPLIMPSLSASALFPDGSVDLVFIDGNHGYTNVKRDLSAWLPKVKPGGILCGHDCDASYRHLDARLKVEIVARREDDVYTNVGFPGPPLFHAGVVTAVYEQFGRRAKLWCHSKPSTIWSVDIRMSPLERIRSWFATGKGVPPDGRGLPSAEWPDLQLDCNRAPSATSTKTAA
jgi:predicted O-methyltransferase YrrM